MAENNSPHAFFYIHWLLENTGLTFNSTYSHNKIDTHPSVRLYTNCDKEDVVARTELCKQNMRRDS